MPATSSQAPTDTLTGLIKQLVQFPTISSDHATNRAGLDWIQQQLSDLPLIIERHESKGFPSLVATTRRTKNPKLWLVAHLDVVPGAPDTFKPEVRDGRLYGRGAHDMKYAIGIFMALLRDLGSQLPELDLGLIITTDEEVGGFNGVGTLTSRLGYRGQCAFVPDASASWQFEAGAKGVMWWDLTAHGRAAHAARTWQGLSAIDELYRFIGQLRTHIPAEPCGDSKHRHTTLNIGTIAGGTAANAVAEQAQARVDVRVAPGTSLAGVRSWFEAAHAAVPSVTATEVVSDPPFRIANTAPMQRFAAITEEITGHGITHAIAHGSSDARFFAALGIPTVNVSPNGSGYHIPREWIELEDLAHFYEITRRFVLAEAAA
jgi:succinyl-diaminopimelate desuccinylase